MKAAQYELPGKSSLNVRSACPIQTRPEWKFQRPLIKVCLNTLVENARTLLLSFIAIEPFQSIFQKVSDPKINALTLAQATYQLPSPTVRDSACQIAKEDAAQNYFVLFLFFTIFDYVALCLRSVWGYWGSLVQYQDYNYNEAVEDIS